MNRSLQVIFRKSDNQESIIVVKREINKEMVLKVIWLQQFLNDKYYNYNLYLYNIKKFKFRRNKSIKLNT